MLQTDNSAHHRHYGLAGQEAASGVDRANKIWNVETRGRKHCLCYCWSQTLHSVQYTKILQYLNARECPLGFANIASANYLCYKFDCFKTSVTCWSVKLNFIIFGRVSGHLVKRRVICCVKLGFLISWHSRRNMSNEKCIIALQHVCYKHILWQW